MTRRPPLVLTMGEPGGIGAELALKAWSAERAALPFFVVDDPDRLAQAAATLGLDASVRAIATPGEAAAVAAEALPVLPLGMPIAATPGRADPANAAAVTESIRRAVALTQEGLAAAVVTSPIQKESLYAAGFPHPGHTEFLAALTGVPEQAVMMLASPLLRVVPVTVHQSLRSVPDSLTTERIVQVARTTAAALQAEFGIARPRLAIAGLNPHAGEGGTLGTEDRDVVAPAVAALAALGLDVRGPLPADTLFHARARAGYDAALCMYHDQALIPVKALDFDRAVNVTLGLPIVRTSPDHGTALDIAGRNQADPSSLIAALRLAAEMADCRRRKLA